MGCWSIESLPPAFCSLVPIYTAECGEKFLSKETTQLQGPGLEPQTFRLKVRGVNDYITVPPDFNHYKGKRN